MLKKITVTNRLGESIELELARPELSGLAVLSVDGIGSVNGTISLNDSRFDGSIFNSSRLAHRNILLSLGYYGTDTEASRIKTYKYFPTKEIISLTIETTNRIVSATGYVESNEASVFSKDSGCSISIICPDPYFYGMNEVIHAFGSVDPAFELPFSNESLVSPLIEISTLTYNTETNIYYAGEGPVGVTVFIYANGAANDVSVVKTDTLDTISIDSSKIISIVGSDITAADIIEISTRRGNKYARLLRSGTYYNILSALGINPGWFTLLPGDNSFGYTADTGATNLDFEIRHAVAYRGV